MNKNTKIKKMEETYLMKVQQTEVKMEETSAKINLSVAAQMKTWRKKEAVWGQKLENKLRWDLLSHFLPGEREKKIWVGPITFFFPIFFLSHFLLQSKW